MSLVIAAALFAQLVVVGGDPAACRAHRARAETPVGTLTVRELVELMARNECVRYVVPAHLLSRTVELAPPAREAKDWRAAARRALAALGITLHDETVVRVDGPPAPAPPSALTGEELDRGIRCKAPGECVITRALVERLLADPTALAMSARIVPSIHDGQADGFKLYAIRPDSLWARLGFENGDTVQTINGLELTSPEKALEIYTRLRSTNDLTVRIVRRGQPLTLHFEIR